MYHRSASPQPITHSLNFTLLIMFEASHCRDAKPSIYCLPLFINIYILFIKMSQSLSFLFILIKFKVIFILCFSKTFKELYLFCFMIVLISFMNYRFYTTSRFSLLFKLKCCICMLSFCLRDLFIYLFIYLHCN